MNNYIATFSNGTSYTTHTKRPTGFAWRVEFSGMDAGGFSATRENAEKAMNAWVARVKKNGANITFKEVAKAEMAR